MILKHPEIEEVKDSPTHQILDGRVYTLRKMTSDEFFKFMQNIELVEGKLKTKCWQWTGRLTRNYGVFSTQGISAWVHRLSYTHFIGPIPEGHIVDHRCENRKCAHPDHLKPATLSQNNLRSFWRIKDRLNYRLPFCWKEETVFYQKDI